MSDFGQRFFAAVGLADLPPATLAGYQAALEERLASAMRTHIEELLSPDDLDRYDGLNDETVARAFLEIRAPEALARRRTELMLLAHEVRRSSCELVALEHVVLVEADPARADV